MFLDIRGGDLAVRRDANVGRGLPLPPLSTGYFAGAFTGGDMNAPLPVIATHVGITTDEDARDLAFARLAALLQDEGGTLAAIARLCGYPGILEALSGLESLHRGPRIDDQDVIRDAIALLETLREVLVSIPSVCEIKSVILETDRALVANLDAALRYAGARIDDNLRALEGLLR
ncbi:MAG: hypothetical protein NXH83_08965 [Rhodobacteraceae bacterium]|nr:hypothetical protein [Paracoccaceae bacterium]